MTIIRAGSSQRPIILKKKLKKKADDSLSLYYSSTIHAAIVKGLSAFLLETTTPEVYNSAVKIHSRMRFVMQGSTYLKLDVRKLYTFKVILKHP